MEGHVLVHDPAEDDQEGSHKEGDLQTASDGDTDGQVHLVLACDYNGSNVLGSVTDDGDKDKTDKSPTHTGRLDDGLDASDEVLCAS